MKRTVLGLLCIAAITSAAVAGTESLFRKGDETGGAATVSAMVRRQRV